MVQVFEEHAKQNCWMQFFAFSKYKSINFDVTNEINTEHNQKVPYIPDHPSRILIIGGSRKTNALFNLANHQDDYDNAINKIYLWAKDLFEAKY